MRLVSLLLVAGMFFSSCASLTKNLFKDPEVKVTGISVKNVSKDDVTVDLKLNIFNPNSLSLDLGKVTYGLSLSGHKVTEGVSDQKVPIKANADNEVVIPLTFKYDTVGSLLTGLFKKTLTKQYELTGSVDVGIFSIPFSKQGEIEIGKK